ncbi:RNA polymerase sigma-70 factor [Nonomuraea sp. NPDC000554]|uniref:RNA polymerase sigma-70 factor n=1 Tax=Nonomuraea sp. NPDC000554 TaxID=3154259 RepID=UPI0033249238
MSPTPRSSTEFEEHRQRLFGLAYRLLGSAAEAEDVVQDAYLRWRDASPDNPAAWLARVVTNLCLNRLTSARVTRESYVGPWLPEPVQSARLGPLETAEQRDSVSIALLVLLERLTPAERAVFVLREAFAYDYREIAEVLDLSEAHCRQLRGRARRRLGEPRRFDRPSPEHWREVVERFLKAASDGDLESLERLLTRDVAAWADGGGKVVAARRPIEGPARLATWAAGTLAKFGVGYEYSFEEYNGRPAIVGRLDGRIAAVVAIDLDGDLISRIWAVLNPAKLSHLREP